MHAVLSPPESSDRASVASSWPDAPMPYYFEPFVSAAAARSPLRSPARMFVIA